MKNNIQTKTISNNYNGKTRENYLRNIFSKNNNHKQIDKKVINILLYLRFQFLLYMAINCR